MRIAVMHIVEIQVGFKVGISRTGKEIQTTVKCKQGISLFNNRRYRGKHKNVIVSFSACQFPHFLNRVFFVPGVQVMQPDSLGKML